MTQHVTKSCFSPITFQGSVFTLCYVVSIGISMQKYADPYRFYCYQKCYEGYNVSKHEDDDHEEPATEGYELE